MYYARWIDGLLDVTDDEKDGYKPMGFSDAPEAPSGYGVASYWKETDSAWVQTWEIDAPAQEDELTDAEALQIILGGGDA